MVCMVCVSLVFYKSLVIITNALFEAEMKVTYIKHLKAFVLSWVMLCHYNICACSVTNYCTLCKAWVCELFFTCRVLDGKCRNFFISYMYLL
jgi:membrane protein CcdC involved in cytochrome C biogenesis